MCLSASLYESHQQKKAANEAQHRASMTSLAASANERSEQAAAAAEQVKEPTPVEADEAAALALARKSQGIQSTQLNKHLG